MSQEEHKTQNPFMSSTPGIPEGVNQMTKEIKNLQTEESNEEKKRLKEEKKNEKKNKKLQKQREREQKRLKELEEQRKAMEVTFEEALSGSKAFGYLPLIQSTTISELSLSGFQYFEVVDLDKSLKDKEVCIRVRVHTTRGKGKSAFLLLRSGCFSVQATLFASDSIPKEMVKFASKLSKESVVEVQGFVRAVDEEIQSATQKDVEIEITRLYCVSEAISPLPLLVEDAMKVDKEAESLTGAVTNEKERSEKQKELNKNFVGQDVRLDNRVIDMRAPAHIGIFKLTSAVQMFFRQYLYSKDFTEIHTPKLIGTASEGGANVFEVKYFERKAYLAQSPQLFKQMAVEGDLMKVFEIGPVFRAENAQTHRHLTEFVGLDFEMAIKHHYSEVLDVIDEMFIYIFEGLQKKFKKEIEIISQQYPVQPLLYKKDGKNLRITYQEGMKLLREHGVQIGDYDDLDTTNEKVLGKIVKEKYGTDFYIMDKYPMEHRPFYTMPCPNNPKQSNSYDVFIRGEEISSGAQRVHDSNLLMKLAEEKGVDMKPIQSYVDSFKYGAWPHAGCGIGLERVVMLFLGIGNVRRVSMFPRDPKRLSP